MKFVKTVLSIGIASGLLMGCNNNNDGNGKNNVSPVRYNPNTNNDMDRVSYTDNLGPGANVNNRNRDNNLGTDVNYNRNDDDVNMLDNNDNNNNNNGNNFRIADKAADRVAKLKEVRSAYVLVTGNNAYVAVMLNDRSRNDIPKSVKNKITNEVKKTDKDIDNVYVSVNPDFYDRMTDYADELRAGHPIKGLYDQISGTIRRAFPTPR